MTDPNRTSPPASTEARELASLAKGDYEMALDAARKGNEPTVDRWANSGAARIDRLAALSQPNPGAAQDTGPRKAPEHDFILYDIARMAKGAAAGKPVYGLCPAGCGCIWRDNFDGTMSLGINQRSCVLCEQMAFVEMIPLYAAPAPIVVTQEMVEAYSKSAEDNFHSEKYIIRAGLTAALAVMRLGEQTL